MRGIGDERALHGERLAESFEQTVERADQRLHFAGQAALGERLELRRRAPANGRGDALQRLESARDDEPDQKPQRRQHREQRHDRAQRHARRQLATGAHRLRDLHDLTSRQGAEYAPFAGFGAQVGKPELGVLRQHALRLREVELHAVAVPDLHDQRIVGRAVPGRSRRRSRERCVGQRCDHLLQLMVEKRVGFLPRAEVRADGCNGDAEQQARQQPDQQLPADRPHALAGTFATIQPTPRTLRMKSAPSFLRSAWMCTSTALLSTGSLQP